MKKKKIKFIEIYYTFSEDEKKQFRLLLASRLFNEGRNYDDILAFLESKKSKPSKFTVRKNNRTLWNRLSELTKLAEKFLIFKATETENPSKDLLLLKEFKKRNLNTHFEHKLAHLKKYSTLSHLNPNEFQELNKLFLNYLESVSDSKRLEVQFRKTSDYGIALFTLELLEELIQLRDLKTCKIVTAKIYLEEIIYSLNFKELLLFISKNVPGIYPLVAFHYHIYNSLREPLNHLHYETAKKIFNNELKFISEEYRLKLYGYMMEYNIALLNMDETTANRELFKVMDEKLKEGLCGDIQTRNLSANMFRDYILVALALKKYRWTENFINEFGQKLPREFRDSSIFLGKALLMFHKKDYHQSYKFINMVKPINTFQYVDLSLLKLKVYYELNHFEYCFAELRRLKEYLRRERNVLTEFLKFTKDFCISYNLLLKLRQQTSEKNQSNLQFELAKGNITGRRWIKDKIKEIKINI